MADYCYHSSEMREIFFYQLKNFRRTMPYEVTQITVKVHKGVKVQLHAALASALEGRRSLMPRPLYPLRKSPFYRLNMRLDGPKRKSEGYGDRKLSSPCQKSNYGSSIMQLPQLRTSTKIHFSSQPYDQAHQMSGTLVTFPFQHFEGLGQEFLNCPKQNFLYLNKLG